MLIYISKLSKILLGKFNYFPYWIVKSNYLLLSLSIITISFSQSHFIVNENGFNYQPLQIIIEEFESTTTRNVTAWMDNPETENIDGFINGNQILFKHWASTSNIESWVENYNFISGSGFFYSDEIAIAQLNENFSYNDEIGVFCNISNNPAFPEYICVGAITLLSEIPMGDINSDYLINVNDILLMVSFIMDIIIPNEQEFYYADMNSDSILNVNDIIMIVTMILGGM